MKVFKVILLSFLSLLIVIAAAGLVLVNRVSKSALPLYEGEETIKGINNQVTVYTDFRGMPHIYAENEHDLYFTTGYIMARERLWQMDLIRRATRGELSEIFGEDYVQTDLFLRSLEMTSKSKMLLGAEDPQIISCMEAYSEGVNYFINNAGRKLQPEFRILSYKPDPWSLEDIANIIGYMGWDLASDNLSSDIYIHKLVNKLGVQKAMELVPDRKADKTLVFPDFKLEEDKLNEAVSFLSSLDKLKSLGIPTFSGSNNWAVSGSKTETGKPFLSNDMHLGLGSPGIWIQIHQVVPGKINVTGVAVPGEPFIVAGHNEKIAWGLTNLMVDDIDLYSEKINPDNNNQYFFNGMWNDMEIRKEIINIKGKKADTLSLRFTHRGPLVSGFRNVEDVTLSMRWSGYDMSDELKAVYLQNRASGWEEFREAISYFRSISQNFAYADIDGNIGINTGGGIPVRKEPGFIIRNGETDQFDWKGYMPFDQLPTSFNPPNGYTSSANNKTASDDYPYYISYQFYVPYRIDRIRQMLEEKERLSTEDFKRMITDQHSVFAELLLPHILKLSERKGEMNSSELKAFGALETWTCEMSKDLAAPAIFEFFTSALAKNLLGDELEELYDDLPASLRDYYIYRILNYGPDEWVDDIKTSGSENFDQIVLRSFRDAIKNITDTYGSDTTNWRWGTIHKLVLEHPLGTVKLLDRIFKFNSPAYETGGSRHTVCPYSYQPGFKVNHGASERHIFNTADWDESLTVIPTGISGIPANEFYLSQSKTYVEGGFYKDAFSENAVKDAAKYRLLLKPGNEENN